MSGSKNAALPEMAAALLTTERVTLHNVPRVTDTAVMGEIMAELGGQAEGDGTVTLDTGAAVRSDVPAELGSRMRATIVLLGALLGRFGKARLPRPGGDDIGARRVEQHLRGLRQMGAHINETEHEIVAAAERLHGDRIVFDLPTVTGTENILLAAVMAEGRTEIFNAAREPHVQDLCRLLTRMGVSIEGIGSNVLIITGCNELRGCTHRIGADHIEVASFIGLAAVTGGDLRIEDAAVEHLRAIRHSFRRLGVEIEVDGTSVRVPPNQELVIVDDIHDQVPKIDDGPWPMFPADLTSIAVALATQARGTVLIFEKMFENRLVFTDKLVSMGARIILCDPHRAVVNGPSRLYGYRMESPDIRAGMAMLMAALCAEGTSRIGNVGQIDRGYERIDERLRELGAQIERVEA